MRRPATWLRMLALASSTLLLAGAEGSEDAPAKPSPAQDAVDAEEEPAWNGFDVSNAIVPRELLVDGGPERDEIRSVEEPSFVPAEQATWINAGSLLLGLAIGGEARAYPIHLLEYHEIVNDRVGDLPVAVTYDPIAGSPLAFDRRVDGRTLEFGVSGLIYNGNLVMYDRQTESLWSQLEARAIAGPLAGRTLRRIRVRQEIPPVWLQRHPGSAVLERPMRRRIDYRYSPFSSYWVTNAIPFPVKAEDRRYHAKEVVVGVVAGGVARAYLGSLLTAAGEPIEDRLGAHTLGVAYDSEASAFQWKLPEEVEVTEAYWFAWKALHPQTQVWGEAPDTGAQPD